MATIQVADKPTLNEILKKVNSIYGYAGYKESRVVTTNATCPKGKVTEVLSVASETGGMAILISANSSNYANSSLVIDSEVIIEGSMSQIISFSATPLIFTKSLKIQVNNQTSADYTGVALKFLVFM